MDFDLSSAPTLNLYGGEYNESRIMDYILRVNTELAEGERWPDDIDYLMTGVTDDNFPYANISALRNNEFHKPFKQIQTAFLYEQNRTLITDLSHKLMQSGGGVKAGFTTFECMRETSSERDANMIENRRQLLVTFLGHLIRRLQHDDEVGISIRIPTTSQSARFIAGNRTPVDVIATRHFTHMLHLFDSPGFRILFGIDENESVSAQHAIYMHGIKAHAYIDLWEQESRIRLWFTSSNVFWVNLTHQHELWLPVMKPCAIPALSGVVYPTRFIDPYSKALIPRIDVNHALKERIMEYSYLLVLTCQTLSLLARTITSSQGSKRSTWSPDAMNAGIRKLVLACAALDESFPHLNPNMEF